MELYKKYLRKESSEQSTSSSSAGDEYDPWVLPCTPAKLRSTISIKVDASLIVRCGTGLNREIIESLLPKVRDGYTGSVRLEDAYIAIFIGLINSVQGAKMEYDYPVWKSGFDGVLTINVLREILVEGDIQPAKMCFNSCVGGVNIRIEYNAKCSMSAHEGVSLNNFLPGKMKVHKRKILLLADLMRLKLVRIEHNWYINN